MSDSQTVWTILWNHASEAATPGVPFEIGDVVPAVVESLKISDDAARRLVGGLLTELNRMPDGKQYFAREGDAVVPLPEFTLARGSKLPMDVYPYEL